MNAPASAPGRGSGRWIVIVASVVVLTTVIVAIRAMGTPGEQRQVRLDDRRVQDLERVADDIRDRVKRDGHPPSSLAAVAAEPGTRLAIVDPVTGTPYDYQATGQRTFKLCAVFVTDTAVTPSFRGVYGDSTRNHGRGRQCFEFEAKQE